MKRIQLFLSSSPAISSRKTAVLISIMLHLALITLLINTPMVKNISKPRILVVTLQNDSEISAKESVSARSASIQSPKNFVKTERLLDSRQSAAAVRSRSGSLEEDMPAPVSEKASAENQTSEKATLNLSMPSIAATTDTSVSRASQSGIADGNDSAENTPMHVIDSRFGDRGAPTFLHQEMPVYPALARRLGKEGRVLLKLLIDADGKLVDVEVVEAAGYGFTEASVTAVKNSTYAPGYRDGMKVATRALLPVRFNLQ